MELYSSKVNVNLNKNLKTSVFWATLLRCFPTQYAEFAELLQEVRGFLCIGFVVKFVTQELKKHGSSKP